MTLNTNRLAIAIAALCLSRACVPLLADEPAKKEAPKTSPIEARLIVTIAPGKTYRIPIKSLNHQGGTPWILWNEPGEYTITASYTVHTGLQPFPFPDDEKPVGKPQRYEITTPPVKVQVVLAGDDEWHSLFDGKSLAGWDAEDHGGCFTVREGSNGGVFFHTGPQSTFLKKGYEAQVCNSCGDKRKTGSLLVVEDHDTYTAKDDAWFEYHILVSGKRIVLKVNGRTTVDYTAPMTPKRPESWQDRVLSHGLIAVQAHDPNSTVLYRNIRVKVLPD